MLPGDRLVCAFAHPQQVGAEFTSWPLHVTIVPWFRNDVASEVLAADFSDHIAEKPFLVVMGEKAKLGHGRRGNWVQQPSPFTDIEPRIRKVLKSYESWLVDETTKQKRPYRPHITAQKDTRSQAGDTWQCDRLYIVLQHGEHKEVATEIYLA